jgi:hypothetical protein
MADTGVFATTAQVQHFVPAGANSTTYSTEAFINISDAFWESYICNVAGYNFVTNYASLHATMKVILGLFTAMKGAMDIVTMDTSLFPDLRSAELYFDRMTSEVTRIENEIKKGVQFIKSGI